LTINYDIIIVSRSGIKRNLVQLDALVVIISKFEVGNEGWDVVVVEIGKLWTKMSVFSYHSESGRV